MHFKFHMGSHSTDYNLRVRGGRDLSSLGEAFYHLLAKTLTHDAKECKGGQLLSVLVLF